MAPSKKVHWSDRFKKSTKSSNSNNQNLLHGLPSSLSNGGDDEEITPGPRPRWVPKPEQIRILEAIYNSGMTNPRRDAIKKIREQLEEFGEIGDSSVFYWFQNRKYRSKTNKVPYNKKPETQQNAAPNSSLPQITKPPPNSFSSSSSNNIGISNINYGTGLVPNSPAISLNQNQNDTYSHTLTETTDLQLPTPPFSSFPLENHINEGAVLNDMTTPKGFNYFSDFPNMSQSLPLENVDLPLLNYDNNTNYRNKNGICSIDDLFYQEESMNVMHMHQQDPQLNFGVTTASSNDDHSTDLAPLPPAIDNSAPHDVPFLFTDDQFPGFGEDDGTAKCRVITINGTFEVNAGPFNVRKFFGDGAVLLDSSGVPVLTDEWGVTLNSLHHGADYFLVCNFFL